MFIVNQPRKKFTPEYRREAANLVIEPDPPITHVAKEIGVPADFLDKWGEKRAATPRVIRQDERG